MTVPVTRSSVMHSSNGGTNSLAVTKPTNAAVNDILKASIYYEYTGAVTITPPAGWAEVTACAVDNTGPTPDIHGRIFWKRAVQADIDATGFTFGFSQTVAVNITLTAVSGARTGSNPFEAGNSTTGSANCTLPAITTQTADSLVVGDVASFEWTNTWSSSAMTERADTDGQATYDTAQATAGSTGTKLITQNTSGQFVGMICNIASVEASGDLTVNVTDAVSLGESLSMFRTPIFASVSDAISLGETVNVVRVSDGEINVSDTISLGESSAVRLPEDYINVSDALTLGESRTVSIPGAGGTIAITTPVSYRVFQRSGTTGSIAITGTYTGTPAAIEASFNGGAYQTIVASPAGGTYSGTLTGQTQGQGTLTVRFTDSTSTNASVNYVGIGDIFICIGQSNMVGAAETFQSYSHATLKACLFGNDYNWKELSDPYDSATNQVDAVSQDEVPYGSFIPRLATDYMAALGIPCAFVPCAMSGTSMEAWQPGGNHQDRATLYGSAIYRALQTGARLVIWWQGEEDAIRATSRAQYNSWLDTLANTINSDLGIKLMPCKLEQLIHDPWNYSTTNVNNAIGDAWADNSNVLQGPDFSGTDWGGAHFPSAYANFVGDAWWDAINAALFASLPDLGISIDPAVYAGAGWAPGVRLYP